MRLIFQFITETLREARAAQARAFRLSPAQVKRAKTNMSRIAAEVLNREKRKGKPKRKPDIDWADMEGDHVVAWWHPEKPAHKFTWIYGKSQHINEVAKFPNVFGVTQRELMKAVENYTMEDDGLTPQSSDWNKALKENLERFKDGRVDANAMLAGFVYKNGWVQIRKHGMYRMEGEFGGSKKSLKALFNEILDTLDSTQGPKPEEFSIGVFIVGNSHDQENNQVNRIRSRESIERFLNS